MRASTSDCAAWDFRSAGPSSGRDGLLPRRSRMIILATDGDAAHGAFGRIVVEDQTTIVGAAHQGGPHVEKRTSAEWTPPVRASAQAVLTPERPSISTAERILTVWRSPSSESLQFAPHTFQADRQLPILDRASDAPPQLAQARHASHLSAAGVSTMGAASACAAALQLRSRPPAPP
jgi:hypothetical protein